MVSYLEPYVLVDPTQCCFVNEPLLFQPVSYTPSVLYNLIFIFTLLPSVISVSLMVYIMLYQIHRKESCMQTEAHPPLVLNCTSDLVSEEEMDLSS
jgi:hypothetical protein